MNHREGLVAQIPQAAVGQGTWAEAFQGACSTEKHFLICYLPGIATKLQILIKSLTVKTINSEATDMTKIVQAKEGALLMS